MQIKVAMATCGIAAGARPVLNKLVEETAENLASLSDKYTYAVRSSALNEDGTDNSFAGQYETVTDVKKADLGEAVKTVIFLFGKIINFIWR